MEKAKLLVIDDELSMREVLSILFETEGYIVSVAISAEEGLSLCLKDKPDLIITDLNLPGKSGIELIDSLKELDIDIPTIVLTAFGSTESAVKAMKHGAVNYVMKPWNNEELRLVVRRALGVRALIAENDRLRNQTKHFGLLVGSSPVMMKVYELIRRVSSSKISCMILGESGTGKEMVSRAIHSSSPRKDAPFIAINCGAIPELLVESALFGHKKGAFTGAISNNIGYLQAAHTGTILLDEVDALPLASQVKLLRVLQEQRFSPVGDPHEVQVDIRVLCASNTDLEGKVKEGLFREDLFYRLNIVEILLPPLRERQEDIEELSKFYLQRFATEYGKTVVGFSPKTLQILKGWNYPGNVRELKNIMERAVALCPSSIIHPEDLPNMITKQKYNKEVESVSLDESIPDEGVNLDELLSSVEKHWLILALEKSGGKKTKAAELLKMSFRSFRYRLSKYGMDVE